LISLEEITTTKPIDMKKLIILIVCSIAVCGILSAQGSLKAEYYNGTNFEKYVGTNFVSNINFYWNDEPPIRGLDPHDCSVLYTGFIETPRSGDITFSARVDDGIMVWINDQLIISNWQLNDVGFSKGTIYLSANTSYTIKIKYFNALNEAELRLLWQLPDDPNNSWLSNWWAGDDPVIVSSEYFKPPVEKKLVEVPKPKAKPAPKPKKKPAPKPAPKPKKETTIAKPKVETTETLQRYIPKSVEFERAQSEILPVSYPALDKLARFLADNPSRKVKIEGHTDNVGDHNKNLMLSEKRAKAIAAYLIKKGVHYKQIISAKGYGGTKPIAKSDGRKYHPENRRVEFVIK